MHTLADSRVGTLACLGIIILMIELGDLKVQTAKPLNGIVLEEIGKGSTLEKAGLRPGDILFAWERLASPPANPEGDQGKIESVFDWLWLVQEQAPRGKMRLIGERDGVDTVFDVVPGEWEAQIRTWMPKEVARTYVQARKLFETGKFVLGMKMLSAIVRDKSVKRELRSSFIFQMGNLLKKTERFESAHEAYRYALASAKNSRAQAMIWTAIGNTYKSENQPEAAKEALRTTQHIIEGEWGESLMLAKVLGDLGSVDREQGKVDSAQIYWQSALSIQKQLAPSSLEVAVCLTQVGLLAQDLGDLEQADRLQREALAIQRTLAADSLTVTVSLNNLGALALDRGDLGQAKTYHEESLRRLKNLSQGSLTKAANLNGLGNIAYRQGILGQADEYYTESLKILEKSKPKSLELASALINKGNLKYGLNDLEQSARYYAEALGIFQELAPSSLEVATCLNNLGNVAMRRGNFKDAFEFYKQALKIRQKWSPDSIEVASSSSNLGYLAQQRGDLERAAEYYELALEIRQRWAPESLVVADSLNKLGSLARQRGQLAQAAEYHEKALTIQEHWTPDSLTIASSLSSLGNVAAQRGNLVEATNFYRESLEISREKEQENLQAARLVHNLGGLAFKRNDLERSAKLFERALDIFQNLSPGSLDTAGSLNSLGQVALLRNDFDRATEYFQNSLEIHRHWAPDSLQVAGNLGELGITAQQQGDLLKAREYYETALELEQKQAPNSIHVATSLSRLGTLSLAQSNLTTAADYLERSLKILRCCAAESGQEAATLYALARTRWQQNQRQISLSLFHQALQALEGQINKLGGSRDAQATFRASREYFYHDPINLSLQINQHESAFHILERFRAQSFLYQLTERDMAFSDVPAELQQERRHIAYAYDQTSREIAKLSPRKHAEEIEALYEQMQQLRWDHADINERIHQASPRLGSLRYPKPLDFSAAQKALDPGTLLLSYRVGKQSTEVFVLASEGDLWVESLKVNRKDIGEEELRDNIQSWLGLLPKALPGAESNSLNNFRIQGKAFYELLMKPIAKQIAGSERLLIIPDGPLHTLPWSALIRQTEIGGEMYLAEWKPIHTVLSATVYDQLKKDRPGVDEAPLPIHLVALGNPLYPEKQKLPELIATIRGTIPEDRPPSTPPHSDSASSGEEHDANFQARPVLGRATDWKPLPYTRQEIEQIAALFPGKSTRTFLGADATEPVVKVVGRHSKILHIAAHAYLDNRSPLDSAIVLTIPTDPEAGRNNGLLQVWEIFEQVRIKADLVVLSTCSSGLGEEQAGEGLIGLTRAFQYAGARSVLASLWEVRDRATAALMVRFYEYLQKGLTKDKALQAAQLDFIHGKIEVKDRNGKTRSIDYSAPYFWAPFQIYGDWQ